MANAGAEGGAEGESYVFLAFFLIFTCSICFVILLLVLFQFVIGARAAKVAEFAVEVKAAVAGVLTKATDLAAEVLVLVEVANEAAEVAALLSAVADRPVATMAAVAGRMGGVHGGRLGQLTWEQTVSLWSSLLYFLIFTYPIYFIVLLCVLFQLIVRARAVEVAKFGQAVAGGTATSV